MIACLEDNVKHILDTNNIEVYFWDFPVTVSGVLVKIDGYLFIGINKNHHPNQQHFTLGHELGQFFLQPDKVRLEYYSDENQSPVIKTILLNKLLKHSV